MNLHSNLLVNSHHAHFLIRQLKLSESSNLFKILQLIRGSCSQPDTELLLGFPGGSVGKNPPANAGDPGSVPGSGRSLGGGNVNPLQYSYLENPMNRGAWRATYSPWGGKKVGHN